MAKKSQPGKEKQIAAALMLSYPQMFVWALVFAFIGGVTVWSSNALTGNDATGSMALRLVVDNNKDGQPSWNDAITFDVATSASNSSLLRVSCYKNGSSIFFAQRPYAPGSPATADNIVLSSMKWAGGAADCSASLYDNSGKKLKTLNTYNFHVSP